MKDDRPHIVFAAYQTSRKANGGMESATRIFEALSDAFRWTLITDLATPRTERWRNRGAKIVKFTFNEQANSVFRKLQLILASGCTFRPGVQADILHGNDIRGAQLLLPIAQFTQKPFAFTLRSAKPKAEIYGRNWRHLARNLDAFITLSKDMNEQIGDRLSVPPSCRYSINSIVDLSAFRPSSDPTALRKKLGIRPAEVALGMVGCVSSMKRQLEVICHVMPQLADLPVRLHLIGDFDPDFDGYARACLAALVEAGLENRVVFHGFREDVADWLAALDIVIVASRREGLARCMIEAMACGTPVVSVAVSSAREMLDCTGAGLVVGPSDWTGLARAVRILAEDTSLRQSMGAAGCDTAKKRFSKEVVAQQWESLYYSLARSSRS